MTIPEGIGVFVRNLRVSPRKNPKQHAAWLSDHGVKWAVIGTVWHDVGEHSGDPRERWINPPDTVKALANELASAGVIPHIWGYPWHDRIPEFVEAFGKCIGSDVPIEGFLPDPEKGMKGHPEEARELFLMLRELRPFFVLGITSYGFPAGHPTIPWEEWATPGQEGNWALDADYYCPQLYEQNQAGVRKGVKQSLQLGFDHIIPAFGAYTRDYSSGRASIFRKMHKDEFKRHLAAFFQQEKLFPALICWSENLIGSGCWPILQEFAERYYG